MEIGVLFQTMLSLFAAMAVGFFGSKLGLIDQDFNRKLTSLLLTLLHPCLIFSSVMGEEHLLTNLQVLELSAIAAGCYAVLIPLSSLLVRALRAPKNDWGTYRFMLVFSNIGFTGYPVVRALFGDEAMFHVTIFVLMFQLVVFSFGVHLISDGSGPFRLDWKVLLRPLVLTSLAAMAIYLLDLQFPAGLSGAVAYVGDMTSPLSMVIIGCSLAAVPVREVLGNWRIYALTAVKLIALPLLGYLILRPLLGSSLELNVATVILAMPVATNVTILALAYGGNQRLASAGVFVSTLLSLFTIPAILWLIFLR